MTVPVVVAPSWQPVSRAWLTAAMFKAYPHWLDLDDLVEGGVSAVQDDALDDALLAATDWAVGELENMPLHAHWVHGETFTARVKGSGRVHVTPRHVPVRAVTALSWGGDPSSLQPVTLPDASMWWEGDGRRMSWAPGITGGVFRGPAIQFGGVRPAQALFGSWDYVAGFPVALLSSAVTAGATSVTVDDPAGIVAGDVLRVYDPGVSEALTVDSSYVPALPTVPPTATAIPLAAAVQYDHAEGTGVTGMPRRALQALIAYAVAVLMRQDVSDEEPVAGFGPDARTSGRGSVPKGGQAGGLVNNAAGWLTSFKPVLRS